jgi:ABC-type multidrug transport system fused ATPase/permease subunit
MALLENLTKIFLKENIFQTLLILFLTCFISFLKINVISYLTANIIKSIQNKNINLVFNYYKYFIFISLFYIFLHIIYKFSQNRLLVKLRLWIKSSIVKYIMINNNNEYSDINFSKLNSPIQRASSLLYFLLQTIVSKFIPEISIIIVIAIFFIYKNPSFGTIFLIGNIILLGYCYYVTKKYIKHNLVCEDSMHDSELILTEILNNIDKIIFRGYYKDETNNFLNHSETVNKVHNDYYNYLIKEIFIIDSFLFGLIFILIYFIIRMFILKQIDITIFITFFTMILLYRDSILNPIKDIPEYIDFFGRVVKLNDILYHVKIKDNIIVKNKHLNFNNIKFENINFKYKKSKRNILNNLNIDIKINNELTCC